MGRALTAPQSLLPLGETWGNRRPSLSALPRPARCRPERHQCPLAPPPRARLAPCRQRASRRSAPPRPSAKDPSVSRSRARRTCRPGKKQSEQRSSPQITHANLPQRLTAAAEYAASLDHPSAPGRCGRIESGILFSVCVFQSCGLGGRHRQEL